MVRVLKNNPRPRSSARLDEKPREQPPLDFIRKKTDRLSMKVEQEKLQLKPFSLEQKTEGAFVRLQESGLRFQLSPLQFSYLNVLKNNISVEELVQFFLGQGWLVSFRELYALLSFLVTQGVLLNPSFKNYFQKTEPQEESLFSKMLSTFKGEGVALHKNDTLPLAQLPFFRSLPFEVAEFVLRKAERIQVPATIRLIQAGQKDRAMYVVLQGEVAVYKIMPDQRRQWVAHLGAGSLFGERGFLLGQARSADIVTTKNSEILRIPYQSEFAQVIRTDKAQSLQHRFLVLQALQSSDFFKDLPTSTLDSLIFTGKLCQAPTHSVLLAEGQPGNTCYILIQGAVSVSQKGQLIRSLDQGSCFGEISLLVSGGVRTATVAALKDCLLLEIQQQEFYKVLGQNLILAKELETLASERIQRDQQRR